MNNTVIIVAGVIFVLIAYVIFNWITLTFSDFLEKIVKKTLWLWLPFHALNRLSKEFSEKYLK
ncbi:MAG: hypothetical protein ACD_8C00076G0001 [uncultured bacterium]|nr:MAG: hypothetical protein ACD_8C00076G0001 [uncultured bacterium]